MPSVLVVALAAASALLPGTGMATPPESDGSTYTWAGAAIVDRRRQAVGRRLRDEATRT